MLSGGTSSLKNAGRVQSQDGTQWQVLTRKKEGKGMTQTGPEMNFLSVSPGREWRQCLSWSQRDPVVLFGAPGNGAAVTEEQAETSPTDARCLLKDLHRSVLRVTYLHLSLMSHFGGWSNIFQSLARK